MNRKRLLIAGGSVVAVIVVAFLLTRLAGSTPTQPDTPLIPRSVQARLTFTLYYPRGLPHGITVQGATFKVPQKNVLVFGIASHGGQIAVSEQPKPDQAAFDINTFYTNDIQNSTQFLTSEGQATLGQLGDGRQIGSLVTTADTWIIVTAPSNVGSTQIQSVLSAMRQYTG